MMNIPVLPPLTMRLFDKHRDLLDGALTALVTRDHWSPFPEMPSPKVYGETAQAAGEAAITALIGQRYPLAQPGERDWLATEQSPYAVALDIAYPDCDASVLLAAAEAAEPAWQATGPVGRTGLLLETVVRMPWLVWKKISSDTSSAR